MLTVFGIRHHGPGSARSLRAALAELRPDCLLLEGPPEAQDVIGLMLHAQMQPPVALLVYAPDDLKQAVFYPFAEFSPEWQALRFALEKKIPSRFMDLPVAHRFGLDQEQAAAAAKAGQEKTAQTPQPDTPAAPAPNPATAPDGAVPAETSPPTLHPRYDPLRWLAEAAGFSDGERWWERMVEHRRDSRGLFAGVLEAMGALRQELPPLEDPLEAVNEALREAHMRQSIRAAKKDGFQNIAVVCGAWHAPALAGALATKTDPPPPGSSELPAATADAAALKGLPKLKVAATWVPWTYARLSMASGYGAGVVSPGWYEHLWKFENQTVPHWLTRVAQLLRGEDLDASSAQTIEAVRLAEALAAMRGHPLPGLEELNDAVQAIFCFGGDLPMQLIHRRLIIGTALGSIPPDTPMVPLQRDLAQEQKRLRLQPQSLPAPLELDLRKEFDLDRSRLLHRLNLLNIPWGKANRARGKGTFKELWQIEWQPEFAVRIIEASRFGVNVVDAAAAAACSEAAAATALPALTELIDRVLLADLSATAPMVMQRLQSVAAVTSDVAHLMDALPSLANVQRYGNVRQTDLTAVAQIVTALLARICAGLPPACGSLNDDAAHEMFGRLNAVNGAVQTLQDADHDRDWQALLFRLADLPNLHGLIAGRASRFLLDAGAFPDEDSARRLSLALSAAMDPTQAAYWMEGFLTGSGAVLLHDERLWTLVDGWVSSLSKTTFDAIIPLMRRTFSTFTLPERRMMGDRIRHGAPSSAALLSARNDDGFDQSRAEAVLPLVRQLLGLGN